MKVEFLTKFYKDLHHLKHQSVLDDVENLS
jgi:hypothetical protein